MKFIIFDFDGVIHNTFDFHLERVIKFSGVEISRQIYKDMHNGNFFESIPEEVKKINWFEYRDYIYLDQCDLIIDENIYEVLEKLNNDYNLSIISSGSENNINGFLLKNNVKPFFKEVLGMETGKSKIDKFNIIFDKYNINSSDCLFVTDTLGDILEANKVGIKTIAVDFGFHDRETLEKGNPYKIISNFSDLFDYL